MRDILFKAKRADNGEWVEGFYCKMQETTYCFKEDYERNPVLTHHFIIAERMTDWGMPNQLYKVRIDETTLCQYTGLTDKNGQRIWENDIVTAHFRNNHFLQKFKVVFDDARFLFDNSCVKVPTHDIYEIKVIGNIFDNKDLMGE